VEGHPTVPDPDDVTWITHVKLEIVKYDVADPATQDDPEN